MRWLLILFLAGAAWAGENTMPGERAVLPSTCRNTPPFFCVGGKPGGQTVTCGTQSGDSCTFNSTSHATKGTHKFGTAAVIDEAGKCVGVGQTTCSTQFDGVIDGGAGTIRETSYAGQSRGKLQRADGTKASPTAVQSGETIGGFDFCGHDGTNFCGFLGIADANVVVSADGENFTTSSHPTQMCLATTASGSTVAANNLCVRKNGTAEFTKAIAKYNNIAVADTSATSMPVLNGPAPITASSTAISNTVTETVFSNGSYNVAANTLTVGRTFRVQAWGQMGSTTTGPQVNLRLRWGANGAPVNTDPLLIDLQGTEGISVTTKGWFATFVATCRTAGASGTIDGNGMGVIPNSVALNDNQVATTTVDTTAAKTLALFVKFGAAAVADTITLEGFTVEWLN